MLQVFDAAGSVLRLNRKLFEGGEGQVFVHPQDPDLLVKLYLKPSAHRHEKLRALLRAYDSVLASVAAWPRQALFDAPRPRGVAIGFIMRKAPGYPIYLAYGPKERRLRFPTWSWRHLVRLAANCAALFETLHRRGIVIGDVNENNFLVTDATTVTVIDCDSFQIADSSTGHVFPCEVGVLPWTPPELHGADFRTTRRTPEHDVFGLAVLIFKLLFFGRHPFACQRTYDVTVEEAIQRHQFGYSPAVAHLGLSAPKQSLSVGAVGPELLRMFEGAFLAGPRSWSMGNSPPLRPRAVDWFETLRAFEAQLVRCGRNPLHWHLRNQACALCQLDAQNFFAFLSKEGARFVSSLGAFDVGADVQQLVDKLLALAPLSFTPNLPPPAPQTPTPLPKGMTRYRRVFFIGIAALAFDALFLASGEVPRGVLLAILLVSFLFLNGGRHNPSYLNERRRRRKAKARAQTALDQRIEDLSRLGARRELNSAKQAAQEILRRINELPKRLQEETAALERKKAELLRDEHLDGLLISDRPVRGLGPKTLEWFRNQGIETLLDVWHGQCPPKVSHAVWEKLCEQARLERAGCYIDPKRPLPPSHLQNLTNRLQKEKSDLEAQIRHICAEVDGLRKRDAARACQIQEQELPALVTVLAQASADSSICP